MDPGGGRMVKPVIRTLQNVSTAKHRVASVLLAVEES